MRRYPYLLPVLAMALGVLGVALALSLSRRFELVTHCRVFIDGCISISAAGRREPAVFVFRATIIPMATLLMVIWWLNVRWLRELGVRSFVIGPALYLFGIFSPALLIVYIALIGAPGEPAHAIRQFAITSYFPAALVAKIVLSLVLLARRPLVINRQLPWAMLLIAIAVLMLAIASVVLEIVLDDPSRAHHLMQWHGTSAYAVWYLLLGLAWFSAAGRQAQSS